MYYICFRNGYAAEFAKVKKHNRSNLWYFKIWQWELTHNISQELQYFR